MVGPLFQRIIADQFERLRDGDRFWYENGQFTASELTRIEQTTLASIIARNTAITNLADNVFTTGSSAPAGPGPGPGTMSAAADPTEFRSSDGSGNNLGNPTWGSTGTDLTVVGGVSYYGDGIASPGGANLPNPRVISNAIFARPPVSDPAQPNALDVIWGQFITHDIDLTHDAYPDALKVFGETVGGSPPLPFASPSLSLLLGHNLYPGMANIIHHPIVLTPS
jgi:hypothetical protein